MELRVKQLREDALLPVRANDGDAGLDLCAVEDAVLHPGRRELVPTGVAIEIPPGHAGLVLPRSGLAMRHGIALVNAPGLIDSGYRGEVKVLLLNTDHDKTFQVRAGERIAQLVVVSYPEIEPVQVTELGESGRGEGGFGSSGR